jgi:putative ABC transport system substrate-binding protein
MRRRDFIALVGSSAAVASPLAALAQSAATPVIGFLNPGSREPFARLVRAFQEGLNEAGYIDGSNVVVEYRWAEGREDQLKALTDELVRRPVSLIVTTGGTFVAVIAKAATTTIPIVFLVGFNPVQVGLVASLGRPGGNATGVSLESTDMLAKRLEMLRGFVPSETRVAMLKGSGPLVEKYETEFVEQNGLLSLGPKAGRDFQPSEFEVAFAEVVKDGARALLVSADPFFMNRRRLIVSLAAKHGLPTIYPWREYAAEGGLASYGPSITEAYRQVGRYAGSILKGARPHELPVQLPTKFELVINLNAARTLGLSVPRLMITRADEIIE